MSESASTSRVIDRNSTITLSLGAVVLIAVVGWARHDATWKANITRDVLSVQADMAQLRDELRYQSDHRWRATDMILWAERLKSRNPNLDVPPPVGETGS